MQETIVRLKVISVDRSPEEIATIIDLPCDRSWRVGETRARTSIREKNNGCEFTSGLSKNASLEEHVEALLSCLDRHADRVKSLSGTAKAELSCVIYAERPPALNFDESVISRLARLGASLDIDLYMTGSDDAG